MANLSNINNKLIVTDGGNLLVNKTAANNAAVGVQLMSTGDVNGTVSGDTVARFNRLGTDGEIIRFQHDTSTDGAINSSAGRIAIGSSTTGIFFDSIRDVLTPHNMSTNAYSTNISLGRSIIPFKDLYLSGNITAGGYIKLGGYSYIGEDLTEQDSLTIASDSTESIYFAHYNQSTSTYTTTVQIDPSGNMMLDVNNWLQGHVTVGGGTQNLIRSRAMGYPGYYGLQVGQETNHIALFIDPNSVVGGSFSGNVNELMLPNKVIFQQANAVTNPTNWLNGQSITLDNGKVGIGLTDPDSKLDVNAGITSITAGPAMRISKGASPVGLIRYDTLVIEGNDVPTIRFGESDGTVSTIASGDSNLRINTTGDIKFYTSGTATGEGHGGQGGTFAMILATNQNVGIGTTSPGYKLDVESDTDSLAGAYIQAGKSSQGEIQNTGLIIGSRTDTATGDYIGVSFSGNATVPARGRAAIGAVSINGASGMDLVFMTRNAGDGSQLGTGDEKMRIKSNGIVYMGYVDATAIGGHKLEVNGALYASGNIRTNGIFSNNSAPDDDVFEAIQSGRKNSLKTYFSSGSTESQWVLKTSTGATDGSTVDALTVKPNYAIFNGGITFNGDTAATNQLDDYEEGAWTPTISHNNGTGAIPLTVTGGASYVKVGKIVHVRAYLTAVNPNGNAGGSGAYYAIRSLPFTASADGAWEVVYASAQMNSYGGYWSGNNLYFMHNGTNGQRSAVHVNGTQFNAFGANASFMFQAVYTTT